MSSISFVSSRICGSLGVRWAKAPDGPGVHSTQSLSASMHDGEEGAVTGAGPGSHGETALLETSDAGCRLTVSIGIYSTDRAHDVGERMIRFADEAAYLAKQTGKCRVVVYDDV